MQLTVSEKLKLDAAPKEVWNLLRDTARLAGLLPGVESVRPLANDVRESYEAKVAEKIGPFKLNMLLELQVTEAAEMERLKAAVKGGDSLGANRVSGTIELRLRPSGTATEMEFEANVEVLGKMAALGAPVVRRKTTEMFSEFARKIQGQFARVDS